MPIRVMMQEHDDHGANLQRLRELAANFVPPPEACAMASCRGAERFMLTNLSTRHTAESPELVELLGECHERIRRFAALARQAASRKDAPVEQVVQACTDVERCFVEALPLHVADEEESIEPRLRGLSQQVDDALDAMVRQHQQHVPQFEALLGATGRVRREPHDETARGELEAAAVMLEGEFEARLALEESVIFPAIRHHLSAETQRSIIDELRGRRRIDSVSPAVLEDKS